MFHHIARKIVIPYLSIFACINMLVGCGNFMSSAAIPTPMATFSPSPLPVGHMSPVLHSSSGITIDGTKKYQTMDGFGISEAFGEAGLLRTLPPAVQQQVLDDLFSSSTGAGFSMLRNQIASAPDATIEPNSPGSPTASPQYVWHGNDWGQVWLSQLVKKNYGLTQFYADAWSAPGFMKTNGSEVNGGALCGGPGASCPSGDWRQAFANYLVQYLHDYQSDGITIPYLGFANEPDLVVNYSDMEISPPQAVDFIKVLGPTLKHAGFGNTQLVCCESETWQSAQKNYIPAVAKDPTASSYIPIYSGHGYIHPPDVPLTDDPTKRSWQTEWASLINPWNNSWDDPNQDSGFAWAQRIHTGLTSANLSAFFYWWGAFFDQAKTTSDNANPALIRITNNSTVEVSKRLWAFANYSRFIRPGAIRIDAASSDPNLLVSAFSNPDGSTAIVILNSANDHITTPIALAQVNIPNRANVVPYVTNDTNDTAPQAVLTLNQGTFSPTIPARSLVTYVIGE